MSRSDGHGRRDRHPQGRPGRPRATSASHLQTVAFELFSSQGFEHTTVQQIAAAAGITERTFFRYFPSKTGLLWTRLAAQAQTLSDHLDRASPDVPMMSAITSAVIEANRFRGKDIEHVKMLMTVLATEPALSDTAAGFLGTWERSIAEFAAKRLGHDPRSLFAVTVGRTTMAACRAAYDDWAAGSDRDLTDHLEAALQALAVGFDPTRLPDQPTG